MERSNQNSALGRRRLARVSPPRLPLLGRLGAMLATVLALYFVPRVASAQDFEICLRIPVTIDDSIDSSLWSPNERGFSGNWKARGIRISYVKLGYAQVYGPGYADPNTGCFTIENLDILTPQDVEIKLVSRGIVAEGNEIIVHDHDENPGTYTKVLELDPADPDIIYTWPSEPDYLRTYAILAFSINAFHGRYDNELLRVYWYPNNTDGEDTYCELVTAHVTVDGVTRICVDKDDSKRKFILGHEYGHCNLDLAISDGEMYKVGGWGGTQRSSPDRRLSRVELNGGNGGLGQFRQRRHMDGQHPRWRRPDDIHQILGQRPQRRIPRQRTRLLRR